MNIGKWLCENMGFMMWYGKQFGKLQNTRLAVPMAAFGGWLDK